MTRIGKFAHGAKSLCDVVATKGSNVEVHGGYAVPNGGNNPAFVQQLFVAEGTVFHGSDMS